MKTVFIVCKKRLSYFNFKNIPGITKFNLILISLNSEKQNISTSVLNCFESYFFVDDLDEKTIKNIIQAVKERLKLNNDFKIICLDETLLLSIAKLREIYNIVGAKYNDLLPFRDKLLMKEKLKNSNVNVPKFIKLDKNSECENFDQLYESIVKLTSSPFIIKPVDGASSINTIKIENKNQFLKLNLKNGDLYEYEAEQYIDGTLYHVDGLFFDKKVIFSSVSENINPCLTFTVGKITGSIPLQKEDKIAEKMLSECNKVIKCLLLPDGAFHAEFFLTKDNKAVFIEIAARPAGGPIVETLEKSFGINLYESILRRELNMQIKVNVTNNTYFGWAYLPIRLGVVEKLDLPKLISHHKIDWEIQLGENIVSMPVSVTGKKAGVLQFWNKDYVMLRQDFDYLRQYY